MIPYISETKLLHDYKVVIARFTALFILFKHFKENKERLLILEPLMSVLVIKICGCGYMP